MRRILFCLAVAAAITSTLAYMVAMPGHSFRAAPAALSPQETALAENLRRHVIAVASREHNLYNNYAALEDAARYIESAFFDLGYTPAAQRFVVGGKDVRNIEAEVTGTSRAGEIIVIGAHYDSVLGAVGANDNGSGVAAMIELARLVKGAKPSRTVRFVAFVNEEPPFYRSNQMGSYVYARRCRERRENVVAMFSLETIGYYSDVPGSQRYPFPLSFFYPSTADFIAFVSNWGSRALLHEVLASFRRYAQIASEGVAAPAAIPGVDWSDHWSFWEHGYPAVMVTDTAPYRYPHYHTMQDTPDKVNYESLARVVTGLDGMLRELSQAERREERRGGPS